MKKKNKQYFFCIFLYLKSKEKGEKLLPLETKSVIFTNIFFIVWNRWQLNCCLCLQFPNAGEQNSKILIFK